MHDSAQCIKCGMINTTNRNEDNEPVCASCSNHQYTLDKQMGRIVELKIDMRKVKQSTLMQIKAMIQKDIEEFEKQMP